MQKKKKNCGIPAQFVFFFLFPFDTVVMVNVNYNDSHRLFLQSMLSKRIISEEDANRLYLKVFEITNSKQVEHFK